MIQKPKGTKDVLPEESFKWKYVENIAEETFENYGFREIRVPTFEYTELFERGVGDTTDVVQKEMYTFEDKGGRSIIKTRRNCWCNKSLYRKWPKF